MIPILLGNFVSFPFIMQCVCILSLHSILFMVEYTPASLRLSSYYRLQTICPSPYCRPSLYTLNQLNGLLPQWHPDCAKQDLISFLYSGRMFLESVESTLPVIHLIIPCLS